jgi:hypothetical protein
MQSPPESSGYESASDAIPHHLVVNMPFPCRKAGARMRVTKALEKKTKDYNKLHENYAEHKKKYSTKMRSI